MAGGSMRTDVVTGEPRAVGPVETSSHAADGATTVRQAESVDVPAVAGVVVAEHVERHLGHDDDVAPVTGQDRMDRVAGALALRARW